MTRDDKPVWAGFPETKDSDSLPTRNAQTDENNAIADGGVTASTTRFKELRLYQCAYCSKIKKQQEFPSIGGKCHDCHEENRGREDVKYRIAPDAIGYVPGPDHELFDENKEPDLIEYRFFLCVYCLEYKPAEQFFSIRSQCRDCIDENREHVKIRYAPDDGFVPGPGHELWGDA